MEDHTPDENYSTQKHSILRHDGQLECSINMQVSSHSESNRAIESDQIHQSFKLSQGHSGNGCCKHKDTNHTQVQCIDSNPGSNKELELTGDLTQQISEPGDLSSCSSDVHKELGLAEETRKCLSLLIHFTQYTKTIEFQSAICDPLCKLNRKQVLALIQKHINIIAFGCWMFIALFTCVQLVLRLLGFFF